MRVLFIKRMLDRSELELVLNLKNRGVDLDVMTLEDCVGVDRLKAANIHIQPKPYQSKFSLPLIRQIRRLVKERHYTIIHAPESKSLANAIWATYGLNVGIVAYRGTLARIRKSDVSYWMGILNPRVDRVICVNTTVYEYMQRFYPREKLLLNYKGYDPAWNDHNEHCLESYPELPEGAFVVMYIAQAKGRPIKGLDILVKAMHLTTSEHIHLVFIGSYDQESQQLARSGPAADRIHFLGQKKVASAYLKKADAFVLPSTREGLPRVIKESMAEGLPVICTDIPGPTDLVVHGETGLLVPPHSPDRISSAIATLHQDRSLGARLGANGKRRLVEHFSADGFADKTLQLYRELSR